MLGAKEAVRSKVAVLETQCPARKTYPRLAKAAWRSPALGGTAQVRGRRHKLSRTGCLHEGRIGETNSLRIYTRGSTDHGFEQDFNLVDDETERSVSRRPKSCGGARYHTLVFAQEHGQGKSRCQNPYTSQDARLLG